MKGSQLRSEFLRYFEERGHTVLPSSSLVPKDDPSLLFTNAGMVQFKDMFLGKVKLDFQRAASSQKCMRVSGKHNDLETVGRTARHHTLFEMLGNFSFGDYFKEGAIAFGWEFLTEVLGLPKDRLWITIFQEDEEAFEIWHRKIGIPQGRIFRLGEKDNFWAMGEIGPCGPCSEIHIDQGEKVGCGRPSCDVACDCDRFLELWNLVFMQYERDSSGRLHPLPKPSVDTGMGLERIAAVMQGVTSNFETDLLRPIIEREEEMAGKEYGRHEAWDISFRVIADHLRALAFLMADGILPSNEGRGYVLRRLLRRAARHGKLLELKEPFLYQAVETVIDLMREAYPELDGARTLISRILHQEEERFSLVLEQGLRLLDQSIEDAQRKGLSVLPGSEAFKLYDTFGFPLDLAQEIAQEQGLGLDMEGFRQAMGQQREMARQAWKGSAEEPEKSLYREILQELGETTFLGYETLEAQGRVVALIEDGQRRLEVGGHGRAVEILLDRTPFYGESGGQIGDMGRMDGPPLQRSGATDGAPTDEGPVLSGVEGVLVKIEDTQRPLLQLITHRGVIRRGTLRVGMVLRAQVDGERREAITHSHTATHLLHAALRYWMGDHVKQAGSLVALDRLRFDFTHFSSLTPEELERIERTVNEKALENLPVSTTVMPIDQALELGAMALFGEKYESLVRAVRIEDFSLELCGGTHASHTGKIGLFKIISEGAIAAGVRRIEALTGMEAYRYVCQEEAVLREIRGLLKVRPFQEAERVRKLWEQVREQERESARLKDRLISLQIKGIPAESGEGREGAPAGANLAGGESGAEQTGAIRTVKGVSVLAVQLDHLDINALRSFVDSAKARLKSGVVVAGTITDGKVALVTGVTPDLTDKLHAGELVKSVAGIVGGSGGGRADMAQAGGKEVDRLKEALEKVYELVEEKLVAHSS
ncbi:MAG: alanine--tRNA ligase [Nitrospinae bacterium]|nr:alanine--tRNA ligase [Nitrospinota bacterium]